MFENAIVEKSVILFGKEINVIMKREARA